MVLVEVVCVVVVLVLVDCCVVVVLVDCCVVVVLVDGFVLLPERLTEEVEYAVEVVEPDYV